MSRSVLTAALGILGHRVKDVVTGITGVATSVGFDLYGCVQVVVNPGLDKDGKPADSTWYDLKRLEVTSDAPVMEPPDFGDAGDEPGPGDKPAFKQTPIPR